MIELPIRTYNTANVRWHWAKKAKYAKQCRAEAFYAVKPMAPKVITSEGLTVRLVRVGKKRMDTDGLAISFKGIRDGIADALGVDDGDLRLTWVYEQEIGKTYAVKIILG